MIFKDLLDHKINNLESDIMNDPITVTTAELTNELRAVPLADRPVLQGPAPVVNSTGTSGEGDPREADEVNVEFSEDIVIGYLNATYEDIFSNEEKDVN